MYNYNFEEQNEKIKEEIQNVEIQYNKCFYLTNIVITNKNFLIFYDMNSDNVLKARGVQVLPDMNAIVSIPLKKLESESDDANSYIRYNDSVITLYGIDIDEYYTRLI